MNLGPATTVRSPLTADDLPHESEADYLERAPTIIEPVGDFCDRVGAEGYGDSSIVRRSGGIAKRLVLARFPQDERGCRVFWRTVIELE